MLRQNLTQSEGKGKREKGRWDRTRSAPSSLFHLPSSPRRVKEETRETRLIPGPKRASTTSARHAQSYPEGRSISHEATYAHRPRSSTSTRNQRLDARACCGSNAHTTGKDARPPLLLHGRVYHPFLRSHVPVQLHFRRDTKLCLDGRRIQHDQSGRPVLVPSETGGTCSLCGGWGKFYQRTAQRNNGLRWRRRLDEARPPPGRGRRAQPEFWGGDRG